jgi:hypothetical protein
LNSEADKNSLVRALRDLFVNREDCYCIQLKQGYTRIDQPLTNVILERHLSGEITVGSYQLDEKNSVKWLCLDFDPEKLPSPRNTVEKVLNACFEEKKEADGTSKPRVWQNSVLLEASRFPDPSYHVWILFLLPVSAKVAQWLGFRILELANLNPKNIEVFPKQEKLTKDRLYGNFVKLPMGMHQVAKKWSKFLSFRTFEPLPNNMDVLNGKLGVSFSEADLSKIESFHTKTHVQTAFELPKEFKPLSDKEEEDAVKFLCRYWKEGKRHRLEMYFLGLCIKKGVSFESAKRIISEVAERTNDEEKQARLELVEYHYRHRLNVSLKGSSGIREIIEEMS